MSERGKEGRKRYFPPGLRELWGGLACPSRISFSASGAFRKHVSSPWPGNQPFFRPNASRSTAWPGNQPFFRPYTSHSTARPGNQPFLRPCTSRSTAWPGNQPFFRPYTSHSTARPGKQPFSRPYPSQISVSAVQTLLLSPSVHSAPACAGRAVEYLIYWLYLRSEC